MQTVFPVSGALWRHNAVHLVTWYGVDCYVEHFPADADGGQYWRLSTSVVGTKLAERGEVFEESKLGESIRDLCLETITEGIRSNVMIAEVRK